ncbi:hypothetical protein DBR06_SOUSAS6910225 [Sousa chinensis]|nr:hypothetical protein DBR06_SOUSAS6910225 [Sousa chinensis]
MKPRPQGRLRPRHTSQSKSGPPTEAPPPGPPRPLRPASGGGARAQGQRGGAGRGGAGGLGGGAASRGGRKERQAGRRQREGGRQERARSCWGQSGGAAMSDSEKLNLDSIIGRLLEVQGSRPGKNVQLTENEIRGLCLKSREIFLSQPILLELEAPLKICGDIHGQYYDLLRLFEYGGFPPESNYLFLGDYVDRGKQSLETICLLLAYKIKYPENFFLLRKRRYNIKLWKTFTDCFNCLPIAAIVDEKIFCCHGGEGGSGPHGEGMLGQDEPGHIPGGFGTEVLAEGHILSHLEQLSLEPWDRDLKRQKAMSSACLGSQESRRGRRVEGTEADWQRLPGEGRALVLRLEEVTCRRCPPGLSPDLQSMEQIRRIMRPTDVPDQGLLCDLLWSDPDKDVQGWGENDRGVSFTFGAEVVAKFLHKHDLDLICRAHQVVEDGYEFFAKRQLVTLFSAPNYCGEFDNAGAMMSVDETLMCSFQILKPADKNKGKYGQFSGLNPGGRPITPPRNSAKAKK